MSRTIGQIIERGEDRWLVRVYLGRDPRTGTRKYHNRTIRGACSDAEQYRDTILQEMQEMEPIAEGVF